MAPQATLKTDLMDTEMTYFFKRNFCKNMRRMPNIARNFLRFFLGFVTMRQKVSKTLAFTTRLGARFSNPATKSINPHTFITKKKFFSKKERCSSTRSS